MKDKRALLIVGDFWHAPNIINRAIGNRLEDRGYEVCKVVDNAAPFDRLENFDIVVISRYAFDDRENAPSVDKAVGKPWITPKQEELLERYVNNGGKIMFHHDGIGYYRRGNGIARLSRAYCCGHPPLGSIQVKPVEKCGSLNKRVVPYEIVDEEFYLELNEEETTVFLESYSEANGRHPQGWYHSHGKGKVVVFVPGHDDTVLRHPMVRQGILNVLDWMEEDG